MRWGCRRSYSPQVSYTGSVPPSTVGRNHSFPILRALTYTTGFGYGPTCHYCVHRKLTSGLVITHSERTNLRHTAIGLMKFCQKSYFMSKLFPITGSPNALYPSGLPSISISLCTDFYVDIHGYIHIYGRLSCVQVANLYRGLRINSFYYPTRGYTRYP